MLIQEVRKPLLRDIGKVDDIFSTNKKNQPGCQHWGWIIGSLGVGHGSARISGTPVHICQFFLTSNVQFLTKLYNHTAPQQNVYIFTKLFK